MGASRQATGFEGSKVGRATMEVEASCCCCPERGGGLSLVVSSARLRLSGSGREGGEGGTCPRALSRGAGGKAEVGTSKEVLG